MTLNQAAILMRCSPRKVRSLIRTQQLPAQRVGKHGYSINAADLERWTRQPSDALRPH